MADEKPSGDLVIPSSGSEQADAEATVRQAEAEIKASQDDLKSMYVEEALDDDPKVRESAARMHETIATAEERHNKAIEEAKARRQRALEKLDTPRYWAKPWKGMLRYQCAYCNRDYKDEQQMLEHQADKHGVPDEQLGPAKLDRFGRVIAQEAS